MMPKLDESKVWHILRQSRKSTPADEIAGSIGVSPRWIQLLCARYGNVDLKDVTCPMRMGRPKNDQPRMSQTHV